MNVRTKEGKFLNNAKRVEKTCIKCGTIFVIKESALKYGRGKYCSRKCCDEHKKIICIGAGNGTFGRKMGEDEKRRRSNISTLFWKNPIIKKKRAEAINKFVKVHGYYPGSDILSLNKRKETLMKRYGVDHVWKLKWCRQKCDETCLKRYGKTSWQIANEALKLFSTEIEEKTKTILESNGVVFQTQYSIQSEEGSKIYDFRIPSSNTLIEVDGDFWHGNPLIYPEETLLEVQRINKKNDLFKTNLATRLGFRLLRFWEHEVKNPDFEKKLLSLL